MLLSGRIVSRRRVVSGAADRYSRREYPPDTVYILMGFREKVDGCLPLTVSSHVTTLVDTPELPVSAIVAVGVRVFMYPPASW